MQKGHKPTLEAIAEAAWVSSATACRYFPSIDALLVEASIDLAVPEPDALFPPGTGGDSIARLTSVDTVLHDMILANEASVRLMLASTIELRAHGAAANDVPARQNRRTPLIEAALAPARSEFRPAAPKTLAQALALVVGSESMIVFKDVLQLDDAQARKVKRWMIGCLVEAARK
ncbi:MAG: TetR/AcrR family transcriptional regulator [Burkholderiaceae bacterium]